MSNGRSGKITVHVVTKFAKKDVLPTRQVVSSDYLEFQPAFLELTKYVGTGDSLDDQETNHPLFEEVMARFCFFHV